MYDLKRGRLRKAFQFRGAQVRQQPEGDEPGLQFTFRAVIDIGQRGAAQILGALERETLATGPLPAPVVLARDARGKYKLSAVVGLQAVAADGAPVTVVRDSFSKHTFEALTSDAYDYSSKAPVPFVAMGSASGSRYAVNAWRIDLRDGVVDSAACSDRPVAETVKQYGSRADGARVLKAWTAKTRSPCF